MINPVEKIKNKRNLNLIAPHIKGWDYYITFGTLLGYVRKQSIIENDDDIDFHMNLIYRQPLIETLKKLGFDISIENAFFVQGKRVIDNTPTYIDFYLFEDTKNGYLLDRWNFEGAWFDNTKNMHIPKTLTHPTQTVFMENAEIQIPNNAASMAEFLYGPKYLIPMSKIKGEYKVRIVNHTPQITYKENK